MVFYLANPSDICGCMDLCLEHFIPGCAKTKSGTGDTNIAEQIKSAALLKSSLDQLARRPANFYAHLILVIGILPTLSPVTRYFVARIPSEGDQEAPTNL